jgi:hypothetical protein
MPGVSTEMKEQLHKNLETVKTTIGKIDIAAHRFHEEAHRQPTADHDIVAFKAKDADLVKRQAALEVGGTDDKRYQILKEEIRVAMSETGPKLLKAVDAEIENFRLEGWKESVLDTAGHHVDLAHFDGTFQGVLKKIVLDHGAGDHGGTVLTDKTACKHWVSGSERIFGNYASGHLTFIGHGRHTGSGNSQYNVTLVRGGTTKATTA